MYRKIALFSFIILISYLSHASDGPQTKQLRVHFDINKTIIGSDAVQGKDLEASINGIIAECTEAAWSGLHKQSYYAYVTAQIAQENPTLAKTDESFKNKRFERLQLFSSYLEQHHPEKLKLYQDEKAQMMRALQGEGLVIFPSFYKAIKWLETNYSQKYALFLRTFGTDLPEVVSAIRKNTGLELANQSSDLTAITPRTELLNAMANPHMGHWAIRDDYGYWKSKGFKAVGGKPFSIDVSDTGTLSIFFDDNANDQDKPISYPFGPNDELLDTNELIKRGYIVAVNPKEAILDEDYFINKLKAIPQ